MTSGVYERTPEMKTGKYKRTPKHCDALSKNRLQYNKDHPEFLERNVEMWQEYWADQDNRDAQSDRLLEYCKDPKVLKLMSESMKNSETMQLEHERQRGGQDIVMHHYIYDESDLSKYTIK